MSLFKNIITDEGNLASKVGTELAKGFAPVFEMERERVDERQYLGVNLLDNLTKYQTAQLGSSNATEQVHDSANYVHGLTLINPNSALVVLQLFDATSGNVTLGTTTPDYSVAVAANDKLYLPPRLVHYYGFGTALTIGATTDIEGNTAPTSDIKAILFHT